MGNQSKRPKSGVNLQSSSNNIYVKIVHYGNTKNTHFQSEILFGVWHIQYLLYCLIDNYLRYK